MVSFQINVQKPNGKRNGVSKYRTSTKGPNSVNYDGSRNTGVQRETCSHRLTGVNPLREINS